MTEQPFAGVDIQKQDDHDLESRVVINADSFPAHAPVPTPASKQPKKKRKKRTKKINRTANSLDDEEAAASDSYSKQSDNLTITYTVQKLYPK